MTYTIKIWGDDVTASLDEGFDDVEVVVVDDVGFDVVVAVVLPDVVAFVVVDDAADVEVAVDDEEVDLDVDVDEDDKDDVVVDEGLEVVEVVNVSVDVDDVGTGAAHTAA
jgi:hypothetical protein